MKGRENETGLTVHCGYSETPDRAFDYGKYPRRPTKAEFDAILTSLDPIGTDVFEKVAEAISRIVESELETIRHGEGGHPLEGVVILGPGQHAVTPRFDYGDELWNIYLNEEDDHDSEGNKQDAGKWYPWEEPDIVEGCYLDEDELYYHVQNSYSESGLHTAECFKTKEEAQAECDKRNAEK